MYLSTQPLKFLNKMAELLSKDEKPMNLSVPNTKLWEEARFGTEQPCKIWCNCKFGICICGASEKGQLLEDDEEQQQKHNDNDSNNDIDIDNDNVKDNNSNVDWEEVLRQKPSASSEIKALEPELFLLTGTKEPYVSNEMVLANSLLELRQRVYALEKRIKIDEPPVEKLKTVSNEEWQSMILASIHYGDIDSLGVSKNFMKLFLKDKYNIRFSAHYIKRLNSALKTMVESNVLKVCSDQLYSIVDV